MFPRKGSRVTTKFCKIFKDKLTDPQTVMSHSKEGKEPVSMKLFNEGKTALKTKPKRQRWTDRQTDRQAQG